MRTVTRVTIAISLNLALLLVAAGATMWKVHEDTWDWRLWPAEVSHKIHFAGRDFNCGPKPELYEPDGDDITHGMSPHGKTLGGATILSVTAEPGINIGVQASDGLYVCALMGGL